MSITSKRCPSHSNISPSLATTVEMLIQLATFARSLVSGSNDGRNGFVTEGSEGEQPERMERGARWIEFEPPVIRDVRIERNARLT